MGFHLQIILTLQSNLITVQSIPCDLSILGNGKLQWQTVLITLNSICEQLHLDNDLESLMQ